MSNVMHVRIKLRDPLQSDGAVRGSPHYLNHWILLQRLRDQPADDHRVVHHHHTNPFPWLKRTPVHCEPYLLARHRKNPNQLELFLEDVFRKGLHDVFVGPRL